MSQQVHGLRRKFWEGDTDLPTSSTGDPNSFGFYTSRERWPSILQNVINDVQETTETCNLDAAKEGKQIIAALETIKNDIINDAKLEPLHDEEGGAVDIWNEELACFDNATYLNGPWLYVECHVYRRIHNILSRTKHWHHYDVFKRQKDSTFRKSKAAISELAARYRDLVSELETGIDDPKVRQSLFIEMIEICLWGNATDLSLLATLRFEDLQRLQGKKAIAESQKNIVVNDADKVWNIVDNLKRGQIDIILDNAGFELFVDVFFAVYLLEIGAAETVVCHPKDFGWFVSDVIPDDLDSLFDLLQDESIADTEEHKNDLKFLRDRWFQFYTSGKIKVRQDPFWTTAHSFWRMSTQAPELYKALQASDLVIFKGDLNYRKLIEDAWWPRTTKFVDALGPIGRGSGLKILALRTSKADCFVGLQSEEQEAEIAERGGKEWSRTGKFAAVSFYDGT